MTEGQCNLTTVTLIAPTTQDSDSADTHTHINTHRSVKFIRSTAGDEILSPQLSHLAPRDFLLVSLLQFALFIPEPKYDSELRSAKDCILNVLCNK